MNRLPRLLLSFSILCSVGGNAQQDAAVSMFWNTYIHTNPAVTGLFNQHEANVLYRNQWDGVNGAPNSIYGNYGARIDKIHGGLGASYSFDAIGFNRQHSAMVNYAFHLPFSDSSVLSFGISAGMLHFSTDPDWVPPGTGLDPTLPGASSATGFDANFGVVYHRKQWNVGMSATHLTSPSLRLESALDSGATVSYNSVVHSSIFGDYTVDLGGRLVSTSRVQAMTDFIKYTFAVSEMVTWNKMIWGGINFRSGDALGFMAGYDFRERFRLGYNYDVTLNKLSAISRGSHEAVLSFFIH